MYKLNSAGAAFVYPVFCSLWISQHVSQTYQIILIEHSRTWETCIMGSTVIMRVTQHLSKTEKWIRPNSHFAECPLLRPAGVVAQSQDPAWNQISRRQFVWSSFPWSDQTSRPRKIKAGDPFHAWLLLKKLSVSLYWLMQLLFTD